MDEADVKRIVQLTVKELKRQNMLRDAESIAYKDISARLREYYVSANLDNELHEVLEEIRKRNDSYVDIIPAFYRDEYTVEQIAELLEVDARTISRNKKRLCLEIYMRLAN